MVYFPRETISFSPSTVLSSAGSASLSCYSSLSFLFSFLPFPGVHAPSCVS